MSHDNHHEHDEILSNLAAKRDRLREQLDEVERALEGYKLALRIGSSRPTGSKRRHSLMAYTRQIVADLEGQFTVTDVKGLIERKHPGKAVNPSSLSKVMSRLTESGEIDLLQEGAGKRPAIYRGKQYGKVSPEHIRLAQ